MKLSVALLLVFATLVPAQEDSLPGRWLPVSGLATTAAWQGFQARFGDSWSVYANGATDAPSLVVGPGIALEAPVRADEAGIARARALLEELRDVLRVDDPSAFELERVSTVPGGNGQEMVSIIFKQTHEGLDVVHEAAGGRNDRPAWVRFQFDGSLGRVVLLGSDAAPGLAVPAETSMSEEAAAAAALATLPASATVERVATRTYVSVRDGAAVRVREARVATRRPVHDWRFLFDARTGAQLELRDEARATDVVGTVRAGTSDYPNGNFAVRPLKEARVAVLGGNEAFTDSLGNFTIPHAGSAPVAVSSILQGAWADVTDVSGNGNLVFLQGVTPGTPATLTLNPNNGSELETAEVAGYHWTTEMRTWLKNVIPGFNGLAGLPVRVNDIYENPNGCQAYASSAGLLFFRSNMGCNNTATQDIIAHEYGHAFHWWFLNGAPVDAGFSEGIGDHLSLYVTGQREMGRNLTLQGNPLRNYNGVSNAALRQWPCTGCEVHVKGEVWAGFTADVRDNLVASMGLFGAVHARTLTVGQYAMAPIDMVDALVGVFLMDDNDGNLSNGTPRCADLVAAANRHSLPLPFVLPLSCGGDPPAPPAPEYRAPVFEAGLGGGLNDSHPALDGAGHAVFWVSDRAGGLGGQDLWTATRPAVNAPWSAPANATALNSTSNENSVTVTPDGLLLVLSSDRAAGSTSRELYVVRRSSVSDPWGLIGRVFAPTTTFNDEEPTISSDGLELIFVSDRSGSKALWTSVRPDLQTAFPAPVRIVELDTSNDERSPALSSNGRKLFLSRATPPATQLDTFIYRRIARGQAWSLWRVAGEINSATASDFGGDESADGFSFWFSRTGTFTTSIWRADRVLPKLNAPAYGDPTKFQTIALRRDPGDVGFIFLGLDPLPPTQLPNILGTLQMIPLVEVAKNLHDENGLVSWVVRPPIAYGVRLYFQGLSQDASGQLHISDRAAFNIIPWWPGPQ
jgi:hypothetical protein